MEYNIFIAIAQVTLDIFYYIKLKVKTWGDYIFLGINV